MADRNEADALFATKRKKQQEEQAEQERHEDGRDGREKVGHKKQHDRRAVFAEIAFHSGLPFFLSNT